MQHAGAAADYVSSGYQAAASATKSGYTMLAGKAEDPEAKDAKSVSKAWQEVRKAK
jgi:hypothetical protein